MTAPTPDLVMAAARQFLGVPFLHQGRGPRGMDCLGLLVATASVLGYDASTRLDYGRRPTGGEMLRGFRGHMVQRPLRDATPGCVVLFSRNLLPHHVAILTDRYGRGMLHASDVHRKVVEHYMNDEWWALARFCFAFPPRSD